MNKMISTKSKIMLLVFIMGVAAFAIAEIGIWFKTMRIKAALDNAIDQIEDFEITYDKIDKVSLSKDRFRIQGLQITDVNADKEMFFLYIESLLVKEFQETKQSKIIDIQVKRYNLRIPFMKQMIQDDNARNFTHKASMKALTILCETELSGNLNTRLHHILQENDLSAKLVLSDSVIGKLDISINLYGEDTGDSIENVQLQEFKLKHTPELANVSMRGTVKEWIDKIEPYLEEVKSKSLSKILMQLKKYNQNQAGICVVSKPKIPVHLKKIIELYVFEEWVELITILNLKIKAT